MREHEKAMEHNDKVLAQQEAGHEGAEVYSRATSLSNPMYDMYMLRMPASLDGSPACMDCHLRVSERFDMAMGAAQAEAAGEGAGEGAGEAAAAAEGGTADAEEAPVQKSDADALAEQVHSSLLHTHVS
jgi:hypothetical protein